jgi:hypothetical protein
LDRGTELNDLSGLHVIHELHPRRRAHDVFHQRNEGNLDRSRDCDGLKIAIGILAIARIP